MNQFRIESLQGIPAVEIEAMLASMLRESEAEGFRHLRRLNDDYISAANRFDRTSEMLLGIFDGDRLIAIGGVNAVETEKALPIGRIRRVYVTSEYRRRGIGRLLMDEIRASANSRFSRLVLRTHNPAAAMFYERLGFLPVRNNPDVTHSYDSGIPTQYPELQRSPRLPSDGT